MEEIHKLLTADEGVIEAGLRVFFTDFGASSLNISINYYSVTTDLVEYLALKQKLNLVIMRKIAELGLDFAFPSQTVYLEK